ncbi:glycosyltransferase family 4 protein [Cephaloticoccus primus]|uniref:glycosyltransferase family 4 protein n=1 Tax=Cephaloticoccus primus TaxID=1548207 RepID=UPI0009EF08DD|nr:glycosyltransferase family 4 protein [Cephaloticoccus primus]
MTPQTIDFKSASSFRLAIVVSHPIQYYSPWFRYLTQYTSLELRVFYLNRQGTVPIRDREFGKVFSWDTDLLSGYSHEFVPNLAKAPGSHHFRGLRNPSLYEKLKHFAPDAVLLFGYNYWTHLDIILRRPAPLLFRGDSTLLRDKPPQGLKRLALRFIYSRFSSFLPVGKANIAYFRYCGVPHRKLFLCPHCVDIEHFSPTSKRALEAKALRASLNISEEATVLLFAGKLIAVKNPCLLLLAFLRIASDHPNTHLIFSGDGELLSQLQNMAAQAGELAIHVHFLPFANQSAMPTRYMLGDVLVLPSESETWGLAVNEAMHLGRPVIVSDRVGCHPDLVVQGKTGWTFHTGDEAHLTQTLREVLNLSRAELAQKGLAAQAHAASFNYQNATAGLLAALGTLPS